MVRPAGEQLIGELPVRYFPAVASSLAYLEHALCFWRDSNPRFRNNEQAPRHLAVLGKLSHLAKGEGCHQNVDRPPLLALIARAAVSRGRGRVCSFCCPSIRGDTTESAYEPADRLRQSLSPAARPQSSRLVPMGRGSDWEGKKREQADLPLHRLQHLLLVPCGRADDLFRSRHRRADES